MNKVKYGEHHKHEKKEDDVEHLKPKVMSGRGTNTNSSIHRDFRKNMDLFEGMRINVAKQVSVEIDHNTKAHAK